MNKFLRNVGFYLLIILVAITVIDHFSVDTSNKQEINYTEFVKQVDDKNVAKVVMQNSNIKGTLKDGTEFTTITPGYPNSDEELVKTLRDNGVDIKAENPPETPWWTTLFSSLLPMLLLIGVWFFIMQQSQGGGSRVMSFGKSRAKMMGDGKVKVTFSDVAGADEAKQELAEVVEFLKHPKKFNDLGARIPKGVLLFGPPGTGKTLLAKAVAGEAGVPFFTISGSDFVEMFVGVGASRVRDLFEQAKKNAPCIVFIDEIDAVGRQRGAGLGGGHDEREQTLNQLLVEMDGFSGNEGIIVLAATNRADVLDPALLRPGRFDRQIQVANPDKRARSQILKVHARNKRFTPDVNFDNIAQRTPGFSGAELSNVLNEAALLAVRQNHDLITMADIDEAVDRVMGGPAKKSRKYTERERRLVAYHEAGHALIGLTLEDANKVQKVTIVPRGQAGGYNLMTPKEETYFQTKSQLKATISGYMGGRVAEEVFFGDVSSGAHNDIEQATRIARMMVTELGMSELGPIQYDSENGQVFLGRDYTQRSNTHSGQIAYEIDVQVRKIIDACYQEATNIIEQNKEKLICIAEALLEHETLSGEDIESLYNTGKMLEHHDGTLTEEPVQEVKEEKPSIDDQDDLLDEMK